MTNFMSEPNQPEQATPRPRGRGGFWWPLLIMVVVLAVNAYLLRSEIGQFLGLRRIEGGKPMPPLVAAGWLNGTAPTPQDLHRKVVVIEFWATWCGPCREATPHLVETYHRFKDRGVVFIGLTTEEASEIPRIQQFLREYRVPWLIGYGAEETRVSFGNEYIPQTWVVGKDGRIVWNSDARGTLDAAITAAISKT